MLCFSIAHEERVTIIDYESIEMFEISSKGKAPRSLADLNIKLYEALFIVISPIVPAYFGFYGVNSKKTELESK